MKAKELTLSIVLHLFIGYLWILFADHIINIANSMDNTFIVGGLILLLGTFLFWEIVSRITPFNQYKLTHPVKLVGYISIVAVIFVHFYVVNLI